MKKNLIIAALLSAFFLQPAGAAGFGAARTPDRAADSFIETKGPTLAPFAYIRFCVQNPDDCRESVGPAMISLDDAMHRALVHINKAVNRQIRPRNDKAGPLGDVWTADVSSGDCEDFALTKRRALVAGGWPESALRIATALTRSGEGHAVLVVTTHEGDLILDNRTNAIRRWNNADLQLLKIQSAANPRLWLTI